MMTQAQAYISWELAPTKAPRSRGNSREPRRPRPLTAYSCDHEWLFPGGARMKVTDRLCDVSHRCFDSQRPSSEEAFVRAIASSHLVAFLEVAAEYGVTVTAYLDKPSGILIEDDDGLRLIEVVLRPNIAYREVPATPEAEEKLHEEAQRRSILGNSTTAKVSVYPAAVFTMAVAQ